MALSTPVRRPASRRASSRAAAVLGAAAASGAAWAAAVPLAGVDLRVELGDRAQTVGLGAVVGTALLAGALGWALLAVLEHRTSRAATLWTRIAVVVATLSLVGPLSGGATAAATAVLLALHLVVAAVLVPLLRRSTLPR